MLPQTAFYACHSLAARSVFHVYGLGVSVQIDVPANAYLVSVGALGWDGAATRLIVDPAEYMIAILKTQKALRCPDAA